MAAQPKWRIAVTGATGLVGTALGRLLGAANHQLLTLTRRREGAGEHAAYWNPATGEIDAHRLEGLDAVVHLAGENLAAGRWTAERKARIESSRVDGTRLIADTLAHLERKPRVLVSASGINYYGDRSDQDVTEDTPAGEGFLAHVCQRWEEAARPAEQAGIRVVKLRTGLVLSTEGGALPRMLPVFKAGLGGRLGNGQQAMSWIHIEDLVRAIDFVLGEPDVTGAVNTVAPSPVTNRELTETLARALGRPAPFPVPPFALKLALGRELATEALLSGVRGVPARLQQAGFEWRYPELETALRDLLGE